MNTYNKLLYKYINGNYLVKIFEDGTKVRFTNYDDFVASFPESIDIKITNYCDNNCEMCHEMSSINGKHANLDQPFLDTLKQGTELAIGGGNPLSHPYLLPFLEKMKNKGIICNLTVNQNHFVKNIEFLQNLIDKKLIYGLGISMLNDSFLNEILLFVNKNTNCVLHLIAGVIDNNLLNKLYDKNLKILILGYKTFGRGKTFYSNQVEQNIHYLKENIIDIGTHFKVVCFDNLAINQLDIQNQVSKEVFEECYMGDDGSFTMYIDLVKEEFSVSSTTKERFKLLDNITSMFSFVKDFKNKATKN